MVKISVEVRSGAAHFDVGVQAHSIERAIDLVAGRYPKGAIRVQFPIDAESFFIEASAARAGIVRAELPHKVAA